ncbi:MAG: SDR family oxidoreductase [Planctomycetota bacterium]|nr:MAG: SDR family oxidoreductase [Planctomycetota bacterium]
MSVTGKGVLVVGGGSGIGAACALLFAERGAKVAIAGRRMERLQETAAKFSGEPPIACHVADVADRDSVGRLVAWATERLGQIDVVVIAAGINIPNRTMHALRPEDWDRVMAINATGAYNVMHAVLPQMRQRRDGLIVNISSIAGKRAAALGGVAYNASKFAMTALGLSVADEERENGIRVTNIYPGEVDTPILQQRPEPVSAERRARMLKPEDVAAAVLLAAELPPRANLLEVVIKPTVQQYV